jgi:hypothetical protein
MPNVVESLKGRLLWRLREDNIKKGSLKTRAGVCGLDSTVSW